MSREEPVSVRAYKYMSTRLHQTRPTTGTNYSGDCDCGWKREDIFMLTGETMPWKKLSKALGTCIFPSSEIHLRLRAGGGAERRSVRHHGSWTSYLSGGLLSREEYLNAPKPIYPDTKERKSNASKWECQRTSDF